MKNNLKADRFFSGEEKERIKGTTRDIESRTIGEVAVMVVDSSDRYVDAEVIGGVLVAGFLSLIIIILYFNYSIWAYIPLSFILFFPSCFIFRKLPSFKTPFIGLNRKESAVKERAVRAFYEKGLYKTKKNTGVLFFLSLLERKVWVLADKGIYEKIDQETLNRFANKVSQGIRDKRACDVLCGVMKEAGELLARHFPIIPDDTDELPDEVITE